MPHEVTPQSKPAAPTTTVPHRMQTADSESGLRQRTGASHADVERTAHVNTQLAFPAAHSAVDCDLGTIVDDRNMITRHYALGAVGGCCAALCVLAVAFVGKGPGLSLQLALEVTAVVAGWCCVLATGSGSKQKQQ